MSKKYLSDYLTDYLTRYLPLQIGASPNTIRSYRDAFIVFLRYCRDELKIKPEKLTMYQISEKWLKSICYGWKKTKAVLLVQGIIEP